MHNLCQKAKIPSSVAEVLLANIIHNDYDNLRTSLLQILAILSILLYTNASVTHMEP